MATAFKKGQLVTVLGSWDNKGTVFYRDAVVYSCGMKQMVLTDEQGKEFGSFKNPVVGSIDTVTGFNWFGCFPRLTEEEAIALSLAAGVKIVKLERERLERCIGRYPDNKNYITAIKSDIDALHEPVAMKR